jgi:membrane protease YdiL (CAAX protease family)
MKPFAVLLIAGCVYTYAAVRTKSLLESPNKMTLCEYIITKRACSVLAKL